MSLPQITSENIAQYLNKIDIVKLTAEQIMKDLGMFGITITFSGNTDKAYSEIHQQLTEQIKILLENDYSRLLSVLYQVDLSNNDIQKQPAELAHYNASELIAHHIIVRDLKKVLTRLYFKTK